MKKIYRITQIGHPRTWFRVRDNKNKELGSGNSVDDAVNEALMDKDEKLKKYRKQIRELKQRLKEEVVNRYA